LFWPLFERLVIAVFLLVISKYIDLHTICHFLVCCIHIQIIVKKKNTIQITVFTWKTKIKRIHINQNVLCNIWKQTLKSELKVLLTANSNDTIDKTKILTILSWKKVAVSLNLKLYLNCMVTPWTVTYTTDKQLSMFRIKLK
jgi:hypothetical protein